LKNARNSCPKTQIPTCTGGDAEKRNATQGIIGSRSRFVRAAIKRRVCFTDSDGNKVCN